MYTCIDFVIIGLGFDKRGLPIPEVLRRVDPESPAALVLKEFDVCENLLIMPGENCNYLRYRTTSWVRSPQDLRGIPIGSLHMLTNLGWDLKGHPDWYFNLVC